MTQKTPSFSCKGFLMTFVFETEELPKVLGNEGFPDCTWVNVQLQHSLYFPKYIQECIGEQREEFCSSTTKLLHENLKGLRVEEAYIVTRYKGYRGKIEFHIELIQNTIPNEKHLELIKEKIHKTWETQKEIISLSLRPFYEFIKYGSIEKD